MDINRIVSLIGLGSDSFALEGAKQMAGIIVHGDPMNLHNCCAATLSGLLNFSGIYVGVIDTVLDLAKCLERSRGWNRIVVGQRIKNGDVGVFIARDAADLHHIYLVVDATDQSAPIVADNQGKGIHARPVLGGVMPGIPNVADATTYFLRAN